MSSCRLPVLSRYNKPSKELLIMYINHTNNRGIVSDQINFGVPRLIENDGLTQVEVSFPTSTGWQSTPEDLTYYRTEFSKIPGCSTLSIHSDYTDVQGILDDLQEQYSLLLESDYVTLTLQYEDTNGVQDYEVEFKDHLIFFGKFRLQIRPCLEFLGGTIGQLMDLRQFYLDGERGRVPVDLYCQDGEILLSERVVPLHITRAAFELALYSVLVNTPIVDSVPLVEVLNVLTGDSWTCVDESAPFNLRGAVVIYNGLRSQQHQVEDPSYGYTMVIELGDLCNNLQGLITIGYRYSQPFQTGSTLGNPGAPNAMFSSR